MNTTTMSETRKKQVFWELVNYVGMKQRLNNMEGYGGACDATLFQALSSCLSVCSFLNLNTTKPRILDFAFKWRGKKP